MVMGCSLEKTLKKDPWDFQTISEYVKDHKHIPELATKPEWLPLEEVLIELGKVAQKIRERIAELAKARKRLEESTGCSSLDLEAKISFEREERQLTWVLGLLVEGETK